MHRWWEYVTDFLRTGELAPYEDWHLPYAERARDWQNACPLRTSRV